MPADSADAGFAALWSSLALDTQVTADGTVRPEPAQTLLSTDKLPTLSIALPGSEAPVASDLEIDHVLGEGGMGLVYLARQHSLGREVAVKSQRPGRVNTASSRALLDEARIMGSLEHPNVVPVHSLGLDDDARPVFVMKRIDGVVWRDLLQHPDHPRLASIGGDPLGFHLGVLMQVCNALHFAHARGVVHRDLKPQNVMVGEFGEVYLLDWGIAVRRGGPAGASRKLAGTPAYLAPEMLHGDAAETDERTDVYLIGATLHEILTGSPPHRGATIYEALQSAFLAEPPSFDERTPLELGEICQKAMARDPGDRFASADQVRRALATFLEHRTAIAITDEALATFAELKRRLRAGVEGDRLGVHKLGECRFGFEQALRAWPANDRARAGRDGAIAAMIGLEIASRNATGAAVLLAELSLPDPTLAGELLALERTLADEHARVARLEGMDHDADLKVASRQRMAAAITQATFYAGCALVFAMLERRGTFAISYTSGFAFLACISAVGFCLAWLKRKALFGTRVNRQIVASFVVVIPACIAAGMLGSMVGGTPVRQGLTQGLALLATGTSVLAVTLDRGFLTPALLGFAGFAAASLAPRYLVEIVGITMALVALSTALLHRSHAVDTAQ